MLEKADLENILNRVHSWTHQGDAKVSILLAAQAGTFAFLLEPMAEWFNGAHVSYQVSILASMGFQLWAMARAGGALFPHTANTSGIKSVTFFGDIASRSLEDYQKAVAEMSGDSYDADFVGQIHVCARIATSKFEHFKQSLYLAGIGLGYLALTYLVFKVRG